MLLSREIAGDIFQENARRLFNSGSITSIQIPFTIENGNQGEQKCRFGDDDVGLL
jgi:hypothetical protein